MGVAMRQRIAGLNYTSVPGLRTIQNSALDLEIARTPGAVLRFEPERFSGDPLSSLDRLNPGALVKTPTPVASLVTKVDQAAAYNNQAIISKLGPVTTPTAATDAPAGFDYPPGTGYSTFTVVCVADIHPQRIANGLPVGLFSMFMGTTPVVSFRWVPGGTNKMVFTDNYSVAANTGNQVPTMPGGGVASLFIVSYNGATRVSRVSMNRVATQNTVTHSVGAAPSGIIGPNHRFAYGGLYPGGSGNWYGGLAEMMLFDVDMREDPYNTTLTKVVERIAAKYGITLI